MVHICQRLVYRTWHDFNRFKSHHQGILTCLTNIFKRLDMTEKKKEGVVKSMLSKKKNSKRYYRKIQNQKKQREAQYSQRKRKRRDPKKKWCPTWLTVMHGGRQVSIQEITGDVALTGVHSGTPDSSVSEVTDTDMINCKAHPISPKGLNWDQGVFFSKNSIIHSLEFCKIYKNVCISDISVFLECVSLHQTNKSGLWFFFFLSKEEHNQPLLPTVREDQNCENISGYQQSWIHYSHEYTQEWEGICLTSCESTCPKLRLCPSGLDCKIGLYYPNVLQKKNSYKSILTRD